MFKKGRLLSADIGIEISTGKLVLFLSTLAFALTSCFPAGQIQVPVQEEVTLVSDIVGDSMTAVAHGMETQDANATAQVEGTATPEQEGDDFILLCAGLAISVQCQDFVIKFKTSFPDRKITWYNPLGCIDAARTQLSLHPDLVMVDDQLWATIPGDLDLYLELLADSGRSQKEIDGLIEDWCMAVLAGIQETGTIVVAVSDEPTTILTGDIEDLLNINRFQEFTTEFLQQLLRVLELAKGHAASSNAPTSN